MALVSPLPTLRRAIWVHFEVGQDRGRFFCVRCRRRRIYSPDDGFSEPTECLVIHGMLAEEFHAGRSTAAEFILPCRYVTYIGLGPRMEVAGDGIVEQVWAPPASAPAASRMTLAQIDATLSELCEAVEP